jgi:Ca2+-binding EF-hand superfamily protein
LKDLARVADELGENAEESSRILLEADKDQDGAISF